MKLRRLLAWVGLVSIVFSLAVWLVLRGSELDQPHGKLPPATLAFNRTVVGPSPTASAEDGETGLTAPGIELPGTVQTKNGQLLLDMLTGVVPIPSPPGDAIEAYLHQQSRSAVSLLAAWQVSKNLDYLREAARRFETDPQVQFAVLISEAFSDDRGRWIALFKQSSSYNPLADYLVAQEYFRQNQTDQAIAEMAAASSKQGIEDYFAVYSQECEKLFLASGASPTEARAKGFAAAFLTVQPYVETLANVAQAATSAQGSLAAGDDSASAQKLAQSIVILGQQMNSAGSGRLLITQTTGIDIEQTFLGQLPPNEPVDWLGKSPAARLAELQQEREQIEAVQATYNSVLPQLGEAAFAEYLDRTGQAGELAAMQWLASRVPTQQQPAPPN